MGMGMQLPLITRVATYATEWPPFSTSSTKSTNIETLIWKLTTTNDIYPK